MTLLRPRSASRRRTARPSTTRTRSLERGARATTPTSAAGGSTPRRCTLRRRRRCGTSRRGRRPGAGRGPSTATAPTPSASSAGAQLTRGLSPRSPGVPGHLRPDASTRERRSARAHPGGGRARSAPASASSTTSRPSTTRRFGCGTKLPHNVTGLIGVMDGHQSDLRTGLPLQMVETHEPMRLLLIVDADARKRCWRWPSRPAGSAGAGRQRVGAAGVGRPGHGRDGGVRGRPLRAL